MLLKSERRNWFSIGDRTEELRKFYDQIVNDSSSHGKISIQSKTLEDILKKSQTNHLLRRALQNKLHENSRVNTEEKKDDFRNSLTLNRIKKKNCQSQRYKDHIGKILTISNNETNHEEYEEAKLRMHPKKKLSNEMLNLESQNFEDKICHTDRPKNATSFTINSAGNHRNTEMNSGFKLSQKLEELRKEGKHNDEQSNVSLPPILLRNEFVKEDS